MKNRVCDLLKIKYPIIQAPIGSATCPKLAAAVSNAGGLGMLAVTWREPDQIRRVIRETRKLTDRPFGVNLVLEWPQIERLEICLEEGVKIISTFWGDPGEIATIAHKANATVLHTVSSAKQAKAAAEKGVDIIVGQGWEACGHVQGNVTLQALIPAIVNKVPDIPVVAAGGIADGKGIVSAFLLGAAGVWLGTRFLASKEAAVHPLYKQKIIEASEDDTKHTKLFDISWPNAPHRVIRNSTVKQWEQAGSPPSGQRPGEHEIIGLSKTGEDIVRYSDTIPMPDTEGDLEAMALYAGQSAGIINQIKGAGEIMDKLVQETKAAADTLGGKLEWMN